MNLTFLGTGSASAKITPESEMPADKRRCTAILIDNDILIDLAMQSFDFAQKLGKDVSAITDIFISHTHKDHYAKSALLQFISAAKHKLNIWCHKGAVERLGLTEEEAALVNIHPIEAFDVWETAGMKVTALAANHLVLDSAEQPLHYIFERDGKRLFSGCDGGWFRADTWEYLRREDKTERALFDGVILDSTVGDKPGNFRIGTHNTVPMLRLLLAAFAENGMISDKTGCIASHMMRFHSEELAEEFRELGMTAAYDGMSIDI